MWHKNNSFNESMEKLTQFFSCYAILNKKYYEHLFFLIYSKN